VLTELWLRTMAISHAAVVVTRLSRAPIASYLLAMLSSAYYSECRVTVSKTYHKCLRTVKMAYIIFCGQVAMTSYFGSSKAAFRQSTILTMKASSQCPS
jgi:hypothetical protein